MNWPRPVWARFFSTRAVTALATLGPVGMRLPAPGTWGSLAGVLYFVVCYQPFGGAGAIGSTIENLILSAIGIYVAVGICGEAEFRMGRKDPGEVILDEVVAMPLVFLGWPLLSPAPLAPWLLCLLGFALFRLFDIAKPFGIRRLQSLPAGWGIVADDVVAALASCATLHIAVLLWQIKNR